MFFNYKSNTNVFFKRNHVEILKTILCQRTTCFDTTPTKIYLGTLIQIQKNLIKKN